MKFTYLKIITISMCALATTVSHSKGEEDVRLKKRKPIVTAKKKEEKKEAFPIEAYADFTSNYMFRGVSQTENDPALQGGLTYTVPHIGIYNYIWGSNVRYTDANDYKVRTEVDFGIGIVKEYKHFSYDISLSRYTYPKALNFDYNEFIATAQLYFLTGLIGYSTNVYAYQAKGTYYNGGVNYDIPEQYVWQIKGLNISGGIGHYDMPNSVGLQSYNDYNVKLMKTIKNLELSVMWTDTNGKGVEEANLKNSKFVFTALYNFT